jgi:Type I site-specific restriction-modification system, R (restriction) subunit and related helicases
MTIDFNQIKSSLWSAADLLWANTGLKPAEFSNPVLGLIFLRYAEKKFLEAEAILIKKGQDASEIEKFDYQAEGALYLLDNARFSYLLNLAEGQDVGKAVNEAMVFFTQKILRTLPGKWTFVIVTDRSELDDQIYKTFTATGAITGAEVQASSGENLKLLLSQDHRYVFSLIQKFHTEKGVAYPQISDRSDIIVITDEAHRSQYDIFALNMEINLSL